MAPDWLRKAIRPARGIFRVWGGNIDGTGAHPPMSLYTPYLTDEGQARLATSSCYWGMPANTKAALSAEEKTILRFDEQAGFLAKSQLYPAPDADLDKAMQDVWTDLLQAE